MLPVALKSKSDIEALLAYAQWEELRRKASASLYEFVKQSWHVVEPGVPFIPSWHIETICEHLEAVSSGDIHRLLINIPPRHSKSTIVSVMWPVWEWLTTPEEKFLCASYSSVLAIRDNLKARRLIQSPWFQERWGHMFKLAGDQNAKQRFENDRTGYRIATSVGGTATGEGGSRLILDDPHGAQDAQSDVMRESTLDWLDMVWSSRLNDPKRDAMVCVMQRLHERDASGHYLAQSGWEHVCIPAEYDGVRRHTSLGEYDPRQKVGELICPDRFGRKEIDDLKRSLGEYGVAGQLQQLPAPSGGGIIKVDKFQQWPHDRPLPIIEHIVQCYDTAFTEKTTGDPTACMVLGIFTHRGARCVLLVDVWAEQLAYPQLRNRVIDDWGSKYGGDPKDIQNKPRKADVILVEEKGSGISLLQDLRQSRIPARPYNPGKADKVSRVHMVLPLLEAELVYVLESKREPTKPISWARPFLQQAERFPNAEHDDMVDAWSMGLRYLKDAGFFDLRVAPERDVDERPPPKRERGNPYGV